MKCALASGGLVLLWTLTAPAFELPYKERSYLRSRQITLGIGLEAVGLANSTGVTGEPGFGLRVSAGHHFNRYLQAEILYKFATFRFQSPDPVNPAVNLNTRAEMNQTLLRLVLSYPHSFIQPYVSAGIGGYNLFGVDRETALFFPFDFQLPLAAGLRWYFFRNAISLDAEFSYQVLFGENQEASTLAILGLNELHFDAYSAGLTVTFHLL